MLGLAQFIAREAAARLERLRGGARVHTRLGDSVASNRTPQARQLRERMIQNSMDANVFTARDPGTLRREAAALRTYLSRYGVEPRGRDMEPPYPRPEFTDPPPAGRRGRPPAYRINPSEGEVTLDRNLGLYRGDPIYLSQGLQPFGSEEWIDSRYPFLPGSYANPPAPPYAGGHPPGGHPPFDPAHPDAAARAQTPPPPAEAAEVPLHPPGPWFPFPHEKPEGRRISIPESAASSEPPERPYSPLYSRRSSRSEIAPWNEPEGW